MFRLAERHSLPLCSALLSVEGWHTVCHMLLENEWTSSSIGALYSISEEGL
jgi:hypothetical protein